jgi:hypothetical protein
MTPILASKRVPKENNNYDKGIWLSTTAQPIEYATWNAQHKIYRNV